ncbi:putative RNA-directed DNA polymerase [Tanacetum coccineum]
MAILLISLDANNPLHLHANDSNGTPLINIKFTGVENYRVWASTIKLTIQTKNKMEFINGTCLRSDYVASNLLIDQWDMCNVVVAELINYGKLMKLMQFLMGIDDVYQPIRSSLLTREILPEVKDAFVIVQKLMSLLNDKSGSTAYVNMAGTGSESAGLDVLDANCDKFVVLKLLKNSLNSTNIDHNNPCEVSYKAKQTRDSFPLSEHKYVCLGELVHLDVWGPYKLVSREGFRYFLTMVDDFSRSDNGTEFCNSKMNEFVKTMGIIHPTCCAYTPQQNGIAKRKHRLPSSVLNGKSPFSLVYGREPNLSHLRIFGCALLLSLKAAILESVESSKNENDVSSLNFFDNFESETTAKAHSSSPNNDEEGPSGRDGNVHQPVIDFKNQPGHDDQHIATPIGQTEEVGPSVRRSSKPFKMPAKLNEFVLDGSIEPSSFEEASKDINWVNAMNEEMHALYENDTWVLCDLPAGRKPIGSKWVFKIKYMSSGEIDMYKSRLVAKGFVQMNWKKFEMDINNAFLYGELNEEVYMLPPPREVGFVQSKNDHSLFVKNATSVSLYLLVYVDDVITGTDEKEIENFKQFLKNKFKIKDL